jgi:hypothetical protein
MQFQSAATAHIAVPTVSKNAKIWTEKVGDWNTEPDEKPTISR